MNQNTPKIFINITLITKQNFNWLSFEIYILLLAKNPDRINHYDIP